MELGQHTLIVRLYRTGSRNTLGWGQSALRVGSGLPHRVCGLGGEGQGVSVVSWVDWSLDKAQECQAELQERLWMARGLLPCPTRPPQGAKFLPGIYFAGVLPTILRGGNCWASPIDEDMEFEGP